MKHTVRLLLFLLLLHAGLALGAWEGLRQDALVEPISSQVLRFRVLANSSSPEDQAVKLLVRDAVLQAFSRHLPESAGAQEAEAWAQAHRQDLLRLAEETVRDAGYAYPVSLTVGDCYFPEKTYGSLTFPRGTYRAVRICLGEAKGDNWWCVLYPPLCFTDAVTAYVPEESRECLESLLPEEEFQTLTEPPQVRFALLDWLGRLFR